MSTDAFLQPEDETAAEAIAAIGDELAVFDDWMERYQYIIELGRKLPPFHWFRSHISSSGSHGGWLKVAQIPGRPPMRTRRLGRTPTSDRQELSCPDKKFWIPTLFA